MEVSSTYNLPSVKRGDTWDGVPQLQITIGGEAPSGDLASVRLHFRSRPDAPGDPALELGSATGEIVILDAAAWQIRIPEQILALEPGTWVYDMETVSSTGRTKTYVGGSLLVEHDITR